MQLQQLITGYRLKTGDKIISADLNATLYSGMLTCLLGPNGSGKSTLLRTLASLQSPLGGRILYDGTPIHLLTPSQRSHIISIVLTGSQSLANIKAYDVVAMGRSPYTGFWGSLTATDRRVIDHSIEQVGIGSLAHRPIHTLSDGERQKVMIAKAIAQETAYIFLDEPTAFLDYPSKVRMMLLLRRLSRQLGKTIFLSTHDVEHALNLADHIWLLDQQHGLVTGTTQSLSRNGMIERYFNSQEITYVPDTQTFTINKSKI